MVVVNHVDGLPRRVPTGRVQSDGQILEIGPPDEFFTNPRTERARDFLSKILTH